MIKRFLAIGATLFSCQGTPPTDLGEKSGMLKACPESPNCVSSFSDKSDSGHYIDPIKYEGTKEKALSDFLKIISSESNAKVMKQTDNYLYAEFKSTLFGFVDDVELLFGDNGMVHVRSASRIGHSDMGVNRKRIEMIRFRYAQNDF